MLSQNDKGYMSHTDSAPSSYSTDDGNCPTDAVPQRGDKVQRGYPEGSCCVGLGGGTNTGYSMRASAYLCKYAAASRPTALGLGKRSRSRRKGAHVIEARFLYLEEFIVQAEEQKFLLV